MESKIQQYRKTAKEEKGKISHIQRLLLFPVKPHQKGEAELLEQQIKVHISLYKRYKILTIKQIKQHGIKTLF